MKAMLLAAGEGSRLRPLTEKLPKPMVPIAGKPILEHNIEMLARYGFREIAINLHHCPEAVQSYFGDGARFGVNIIYSYEPVLLGTAGAVENLASIFSQDTFLVIYGDNLIRCDLERLLAFHRERAGIATLALHYREDVAHSGVVALDERGRVLRFVEKPRTDEIQSHWVNAGLVFLEPDVVKYIPHGVPSDFGRDILPTLVEQGQLLNGYRMGENEGIWWIDTPEDLARAQHAFKEMSHL